jgi:hypothetical protein
LIDPDPGCLAGRKAFFYPDEGAKLRIFDQNRVPETPSLAIGYVQIR